MNGRGVPILAIGLILAGAVTMGAAYVVGPTAADTAGGTSWTTMMGPNGYGMMGGMMGGMMNGAGMMGGTRLAPASSPGPGEAGFVAGTTRAPRVVRIYALPNERFAPDVVKVQAGETITFEVTTMGPGTHEFMIGPAADVAADKEGTPEISGIGMMQTRSLTYTIAGSGPFAFACHEPGHYEAGMKGSIVVQ